MCWGNFVFGCETSEVAGGLGTKLDSQDTEEQILSALRRARIGSRRQIALSDNSNDDVDAAPGSGAQLGATATPPGSHYASTWAICG